MSRFFPLLFMVLIPFVRILAFEYDDSAADGPSQWGATYPECTGLRQSPVNIQTAAVDAGAPEFLRLGAPFASITSLPFYNNGHTVMVNVTTRNLRLTGSTFPDLMDGIQFHFHTPSEHAFDGVSSDMELHLVSGSIDRNSLGLRYPMAVISYLYSANISGMPEDPLIKHLVPYVSSLAVAQATVNIPLYPELDIGTEFFEYEGSLTTPPCYETVHWMVSTKIRYISPASLTTFKNVLGNNNRPWQLLNGRHVTRRILAAQDLSKYSSCYLTQQSTQTAATPTSATTINFSGLFNGVKTST